MTGHGPEESSPPTDEQLVSLLKSLADVDFERTEPPPDLFTAIAARMAADSEPRPVGQPVVVSIDERRIARRIRLPAAAAAGVALVAGVVTVLAVGLSSPLDRVLATAELRQLEPFGSAAASAKLVIHDGQTHLTIDATDMPAPPPGSDYELWLIGPDVSSPRSLGTVTGSEDVVIPSSIDPGTYSIVDISLELRDGSEHHSGHSLLRGDLR